MWRSTRPVGLSFPPSAAGATGSWRRPTPPHWSRPCRRSVPIAVVLRDHLAAHKHERGQHELVFATLNGNAFDPATIAERARRAWRRAGLEGITLHEARHTFASLMIAAGVNAKALADYVGHASVTITFDRYGHLLPGNENEAAARLDAYLDRADTRAQLDVRSSAQGPPEP